jgi:hypothetical protein
VYSLETLCAVLVLIPIRVVNAAWTLDSVRWSTQMLAFAYTASICCNEPSHELLLTLVTYQVQG